MRRLMLRLIFVLCALVACALPVLAVSSAQEGVVDQGKDSSAPLGLDSASGKRIAVTLFRPAGAQDLDGMGVIGVFQQGRFSTALLPGEYAMLEICPNSPILTLRALSGSASGAARDRLSIDTLKSGAPGRLWYRIHVNSEGVMGVRQVADGHVSIGEYRKSDRTVSRASIDCEALSDTTARPQQDASVPASPISGGQATMGPRMPEQIAPPFVTGVALQESTLSIPSDFIFAFDGASMDEVIGRERSTHRMKRFMQELGPARITSMLVTGHSDPIGSLAYKNQIANRRARAVAQYIRGLSTALIPYIEIQSMADKEPVVSNCPNTPKDLRNSCNAPNRRVEVVLTIQR